MLGCPSVVRIVWVRNWADINRAERNYRRLHWRNPHSNGVGFAELNAYDIRELSGIISRTGPQNTIRYILGATGEGRKEVCLPLAFPLSYINYVFIENAEEVRA